MDPSLDADTDEELRQALEVFGEVAVGRAPLYRRVCPVLADLPLARSILADAPPTQRQPVLLLAAIHDLLLAEPTSALARHYPTTEPDAAVRAAVEAGLRDDLGAFLVTHEAALRELVRTRRTQTNEIGRCALLLTALGLLDAELGARFGLVDVGTSAGLNLLLDRYGYRWEHRGELGVPAAVELVCGTRGAVPVPARMPHIAARVGLDLGPIDVHDRAQARWLEACVWPDQLDRFERLRAAISLARATDLDLLTGDAVHGLDAAVAHVDDTHPVVVNTWVLSYLTDVERAAYVAELDRIGAGRDLSWIYAESPAETSRLPTPPSPDPAVDDHRTALVLVRWRAGQRSVERLATCHPHGYWLHWEG